jgi:hypothetical protein
VFEGYACCVKWMNGEGRQTDAANRMMVDLPTRLESLK